MKGAKFHRVARQTDDLAKATIYERLRILTPGPRYMHFPVRRGYDEEFFKQLTAEQCQITKHRGFQKRVWVKKRQRNEALDLRAYSLAAFELRNPNLAKIGINLRKSAVTTKPTEQGPPQTQPLPGKPALTQAPQQRTIARRRWRMKWADWQ